MVIENATWVYLYISASGSYAMQVYVLEFPEIFDEINENTKRGNEIVNI